MNGGSVPFSIFIDGVIDGSSLIVRSGSGSGIFLKPRIGGILIWESFHLIGKMRVNIVLKTSFVVFEH